MLQYQIMIPNGYSIVNKKITIRSYPNTMEPVRQNHSKAKFGESLEGERVDNITVYQLHQLIMLDYF